MPKDSKALVIVESPAKARTIASLLGPEYVVESSVGHIRDLPRSADEVPAAYKGQDWARLGVDVDNGFKPLYVVSPTKKSVISNLKRLLKDADVLYLATDEDREGEAIAWHLSEVLSPQIPVKRMVFHEITPAAIQRAVDQWRDLDRRLVDAQEARRILDRLYGYEVSPLLWKKVMPRLSAGRVQSVATRIVVERERARMQFNSAAWWGIEGSFVAPLKGDTPSHGEGNPGTGEGNPGTDALAEPGQFTAVLTSLDSIPLATGRDFDSNGKQLGSSKAKVLGEADAKYLARQLEGVDFNVRSIVEKPFRRSPAPPFITSTLQQEAGRKLRFSAQRAMQVAQRLYEQGWITYMRTDSTTLSDQALNAARTQASELYGSKYVPSTPRRYERKVKNAQEAHEAIRPAGESFRTPDQAARELTGDELHLYDLIWKRTVASQMSDATGTSAQVRLVGVVPALEPHMAQADQAQGEFSGKESEFSGKEVEFSASGRVISFPGFLRAYVEGEDDPEAELAEREVILPAMSEGDRIESKEFEPGSHSTQPPARYTEASLVKAMEELGVGRPSTYASVIATILDRGYVWKKGSALVPSFTAFAVTNLLERYFSELVDYGFTASMEDDLDEIASGREEALPWLSRFYFGVESPGGAPARDAGSAEGGGTVRLGLKNAVATHLGDIDAREINSIGLGVDSNGVDIVVRVGRYGPYLQRGEDRASIPEDLCPDEITIERAEAMLSEPTGDRILGIDPATGLEVQVRSGRFGPYVQLGDAASTSQKPRTSSLFSKMTLANVTLEQALLVLQIPRVVGIDPDSNEEIVAHSGKFGPYLKRGSDTRSLTDEDQLLSITLDEARAIFSQPKERRGRSAPAPPLRELGTDPNSKAAVVLKDGRFGPYVTDGTTNASLRKGDDVESITLERAAELLADRRAAGPSTRRRAGGRAGATRKVAKKASGTRVAKKASSS